MLILLLGIVLVAFVIFLVLLTKKYFQEGFAFFFKCMSFFFGGTALGLLIAICCLLFAVATESTIDSKIKMYQEENANIEKDIDKIVKEYLEHEHNTFSDLKTEESSITLITLFPELKSDTLVQQQLEIHNNNNAKIKTLKEDKINLSQKRWLLYFGK